MTLDPRIQAALKAIEGATPGPWDTERGNTGRTYVVGSDSGWVVDVSLTNPIDGANAALITLSPVLPAALRLLEAVLDGQEREPIYLGPTIEAASAEFLALLPAVPEGETK